jgi:hypothetical protein
VRCAVSNDFGAYLGSLNFVIKDRDSVSEAILGAISTDFSVSDIAVLERGIQAYDPYGATMIVHDELSFTRAITYLDPYGLDCRWGEVMYASRSKAGEGRTYRRADTNFDRPSSAASGRRLRRIQDYTGQLLDNFDEASTERLLSSINTAALARSTSTAENQLISLWAAVEVLLSDPPENVARISHYARIVVPCIVCRHVRRQFIAVYDELLVSYRRKFGEIVNRELSPWADPHTKFMAILTLPDNKQLRQELCALCTNNPLALHRLWKLYEDFRSPTKVTGAVRSHEQRVEWQIHRMYRARNHLVHSGRKPSYLESLIRNLAEYYRSAVTTIVRRAAKESDKSDIGQIVSEIGIEYRIFKRFFEGRGNETQMSLEDLSVLSGL